MLYLSFFFLIEKKTLLFFQIFNIYYFIFNSNFGLKTIIFESTFGFGKKQFFEILKIFIISKPKIS